MGVRPSALRSAQTQVPPLVMPAEAGTHASFSGLSWHSDLVAALQRSRAISAEHARRLAWIPICIGMTLSGPSGAARSPARSPRAAFALTA